MIGGLFAITACSGAAIAEPAPTTTTAPVIAPDVNPADFVRFDTASQAEARREVLIHTIWPDGLPTDVAELDLVEPAGDRVGFAIFHSGHLNAVYDTEVAALVDAGYAVQFLKMPTDGRPSLTGYHNDLFSENGTAAMATMLNHVIETVNALEALDPDAPILMTGLSGGGWTTHMAAAVDTRIDVSFPVAGSLPLFARPLSPGSDGDAEQTWPAIFGEADTNGDGTNDTATGAASWLEIYALGALPEGRRQTQILNLQDPCCFNGNARRLYSEWLALEVPGWSIHIDATNTDHSISAESLRLITGQIQPSPVAEAISVPMSDDESSPAKIAT